MSTTVDPTRDGPVVAERPQPGAPRAYEFPTVTGGRLPNGLSVLIADLPGRPLVSASMVVTGGAVEEPADVGRSDGPCRPRPDRGHRELRRDRSRRGVRTARRLAPRRRRLGCRDRRRGRAGRAAGTGPRPRRRGPSSADVPRIRGRATARRAPERPPPGAGRPAPTRRRGVRRHDLRAAVARITVRPAALARRSSDSAAPTSDGSTAGRSTRGGRRSWSVATSAART